MSAFPEKVSPGEFLLHPDPTGGWIAVQVVPTDWPGYELTFARGIAFPSREEAILHFESLGLPFLDLPFEPWPLEIWKSGRIVPVPLGEDRK